MRNPSSVPAMLLSWHRSVPGTPVMLALLVMLPSAAACPPEWTPYSNGFCYRWFNVGWPWYFAKDACDFGEPGAQLASIHDFELNMFLVDTVAAGSAAWIGYHRTDTGAEWVWTDGSADNYTNWKSGYPDREGEGCTILHCGENGTWCTRDCDNRYPLLCQIEDGTE